MGASAISGQSKSTKVPVQASALALLLAALVPRVAQLVADGRVNRFLTMTFTVAEEVTDPGCHEASGAMRFA